MKDAPLTDRTYSLEELIAFRLKGRMNIPCRSADILRQEQEMLSELGNVLNTEFGLDPSKLTYRGNGHQAIVLHAGGGAGHQNLTLYRS